VADASTSNQVDLGCNGRRPRSRGRSSPLFHVLSRRLGRGCAGSGGPPPTPDRRPSINALFSAPTAEDRDEDGDGPGLSFTSCRSPSRRHQQEAETACEANSPRPSILHEPGLARTKPMRQGPREDLRQGVPATTTNQRLRGPVEPHGRGTGAEIAAGLNVCAPCVMGCNGTTGRQELMPCRATERHLGRAIPGGDTAQDDGIDSVDLGMESEAPDQQRLGGPSANRRWPPQAGSPIADAAPRMRISKGLAMPSAVVRKNCCRKSAAAPPISRDGRSRSATGRRQNPRRNRPPEPGAHLPDSRPATARHQDGIREDAEEICAAPLFTQVARSLGHRPSC